MKRAGQTKGRFRNGDEMEYRMGLVVPAVQRRVEVHVWCWRAGRQADRPRLLSSKMKAINHRVGSKEKRTLSPFYILEIPSCLHLKLYSIYITVGILSSKGN